MNRLYTEIEIAQKFNMSVQTLQRNRHLGIGLPYIKIGRLVRYDETEVKRFIKQGRRLYDQQEKMN